jgi:hypothetical protein
LYGTFADCKIIVDFIPTKKTVSSGHGQSSKVLPFELMIRCMLREIALKKE